MTIKVTVPLRKEKTPHQIKVTNIKNPETPRKCKEDRERKRRCMKGRSEEIKTRICWHKGRI